ncbi:MAG TPA: hypothetical protein VF881_21735 [Polyangiaceae bacterium]
MPGQDDIELVEKKLFDALSEDEPPARARRRVATALGMAVLTTATAGAEGAALPAIAVASKTWPFLLVKWVGFGTVAGGIAVGAWRYATPSSSSQGTAPKEVAGVVAPAAPSFVPSPPSRAVEEPAGGPEAAPSNSTAAAAEPPRPTSVLPLVARAARISVPPTSPKSESNADLVPDAPRTMVPSTLAAEVAMLDRTRGALSSGEGERALDLLQRYGREFPKGTLGLEASVLGIEALYLTGSAERATALAREFLAAHPTSTHASRVRRLLTEHAKP